MARKDLLVSTDKESTGVEDKAGAVLLFDGEDMSSDLAFGVPVTGDYAKEEDAFTVIYGAEPDSLFGFSMAAVPDLDGDELPEIVIGAPKVDGPNPEDGADHGALYGFVGPWVGGHPHNRLQHPGFAWC